MLQTSVCSKEFYVGKLNEILVKTHNVLKVSKKLITYYISLVVVNSSQKIVRTLLQSIRHTNSVPIESHVVLLLFSSEIDENFKKTNK